MFSTFGSVFSVKLSGNKVEYLKYENMLIFGMKNMCNAKYASNKIIKTDAENFMDSHIVVNNFYSFPKTRRVSRSGPVEV